MRAMLLPALLALPACTTTGAQGPSTPARGAGGTCRADGLESYVGREATSALGAELLAKSGARTLRWGGPDMAMTMDYREDRLTISYDGQMRVTSARCG